MTDIYTYKKLLRIIRDMIKCRKLFVVFLVAFAFLTLGEASAFDDARSDPNDKSKTLHYIDFIKSNIILDGREYTKTELIQGFLEIAFSETPWNWYLSEQSARTVLYFAFHRMHYPPPKFAMNNLFAYFMTYGSWQEREPRFGVINKWPGDVRIALGMQETSADLKKQLQRSLPIPYAQFDPSLKKYRLIKSRLKVLLPELERLTGLNVGFVEPFDDVDDKPSFARMRIYAGGLVEDGKYRKRLNPSKVDDPDVLLHRTYDIEFIDFHFFGGVPYTPYDMTRVEGYFLPDADNNISLSVCKLNPDLGDESFLALLTECLVRSLGLPDIAPLSVNGNVLSAGNTTENSAVNLKEYDRFMIKLLYCPVIKAGMSRYEVIQVLYKNNQCFNMNGN